MSDTADQLLLEALSLSAEARAELTDRLVATSAGTISPEVEAAHLAEVRRRIARVEAGGSSLIPGEQVLDDGRALLARLMSERSQR